MTVPKSEHVVTAEQFAEIERRYYAQGEHPLDIARAMELPCETVAAELGIGQNNPTPEMIRAKCHRIQRRWTPGTERARRVVAQGRVELLSKMIRLPPDVAAMFNRSRGRR